MNSNPAVTESLEHDPLCPCNPNQQECGCGEDPEWGPCVSCKCDLIAKAREDERANVTAEFMSNHGGRWEYEAGVAAGRAEALGIRVREVMPYANGYFDGEDHMLAKCIALIEDSVPWSTNNWIAVDERAAILAALRNLNETPPNPSKRDSIHDRTDNGTDQSTEQA